MKMKKTPFAAAGLAAVALMATAVTPQAAAQDAPPAETAAEKVTFKIVLEKGQEFAFRQTMNMNQDMDMGGMQMSTVMDMTSDYTYKVDDVTEAGDMKVTVNFGRIKGSFDNPMMGSLEFDSEKEAEETGNPMVDMMASMFTANAGQSIGITMQADGEITEVTGIEEMIEKLMENNPMAGMQGGMDTETMSKSMKEMIGSQLGALPKEPLGVGESWKIERAMGQMGMDVNMTIDNTLKSVDDQEAVIDSTITAELSGGQMAAMLTVDEFTGTSTTTVSRKDGLVLSSKANMNMKASMDAGAQGQGGMTMVIETAVERIPVTATAEKPAEEAPAEAPPSEEGGSEDAGK